LTFIISALQRWTSRKAAIAILGIITIVIISPFALTSLEKRTDLSEQDVRSYMRVAAALILEEHPLGIGANNYVRAANLYGYNDRANLPATYVARAIMVHNVYWLVAAETGYLGICAFVLMLLRIMVVAFRCGWQNKRDIRGSLLLGFGVTLLLVYVHSWFEFGLLLPEIQYLFAITAGLVGGLSIQLNYWRAPQRIVLASKA
jgi:O-antigen ligase